MALVNTNITPLLQEGTDITLTQSGQVITISSTASAGGGYTISTKTGDYTETATTGDVIILCNTNVVGFTVTLPTAVGNKATITIKKIAGTNNLTIDGNGSQTIDGGLTAVLVRVYESVTLVSDNSNWHII